MSDLEKLSQQLSALDFSPQQLLDLLAATNRKPQQQERLLARASRIKEAEKMLSSEISQSMDRAKEAKTLDAAFVVDCTNSMRSKLEQAKDKIMSIRREICKKLGAGGSVRFAVVAYRDYEDSSKIQVLSFTEDVERVGHFLSNLGASGSAKDICEDVIGGLQAAVDLKWSARTRILYLLCDAPAHGVRFYDCDAARAWDLARKPGKAAWDLHPQDPKQWQPTNKVISETIAKRISFVGLKYSETCDRMFKLFQGLRDSDNASRGQGLETIVLSPANTAEDFVKCILQTTSQTLRSSLTRLQETQGPRGREALILEEVSGVLWESWQRWPRHQVLVTAVTVLGLNVKPRRNTTFQDLHIRAQPFASGGMRWAFPAVSDAGVRMVVKVHKAEEHKGREAAFADVETQAYAKLFAKDFSQLLPSMPLQFLDSWLLELPNWDVARHATVEPFIPGPYEKYTNNSGYTSPGAQLAEAFSHFTWQHSGGCMQVTDLQGFGMQILTDPQIHSTCKDFFSRGNLGKRGMDDFFLGHCCNELCHRLGLQQSPMQLGFDAVSVGDLCDTPSSKSDITLPAGSLACELCFQLVQLPQEDFTYIVNKYSAVYCEACIRKVEDAQVRAKCQSCNQPFKYSFHVIKTKGCEVPTECEDCERGESWMLVDV